MGVVAIRVLAAGALGGSMARIGYAAPAVGGPMVPGNDYEADEARAKKLDFLMSEDVGSLPQAAVRFALMHPDVSTVLAGFSSLEQVEEAATCSGKGPLSGLAMERLRNVWKANFGS